jgi:hypothetical protein
MDYPILVEYFSHFLTNSSSVLETHHTEFQDPMVGQLSQ